MDVPTPETASQLEVRCYYVRRRNALMIRANFSPFFVDYYLHLMDIGSKPSGQLDAMLKEALVGVTMHCASRPWNERHAWTVNFQHPLANFFVTADNTTACVTGRVFTEDVRHAERSVFYAQAQKHLAEPRLSVIEIDGAEFFRAIEQFYLRSEQRLARFFEHSPEDYVFVCAQPDCDVPWLQSLTDDAIRIIDQTEEISLLEQRNYHWECGCTQVRMFAVLAQVMRADPEGLFGAEPALRMSCPRCGARHTITREALEAYVAGGS